MFYQPFYGSDAPVSTWLQCNSTVTVLLVQHNHFYLFLAYIIEHLKRRDRMFFCHKFHFHFHGDDRSLSCILFHFLHRDLTSSKEILLWLSIIPLTQVYKRTTPNPSYLSLFFLLPLCWIQQLLLHSTLSKKEIPVCCRTLYAEVLLEHMRN